MIEPTTAQDQALEALALDYASVRCSPCPPGALWRAECFNENGRLVRTMFVYPSGHTSDTTRRVA